MPERLPTPESSAPPLVTPSLPPALASDVPASVPPAAPPSVPPPSAESPPPADKLRMLLGADGSPTVEEVTKLVLRELTAASDRAEAEALAVRAALLLWDGAGKSGRALELLNGVKHPLADALLFQGAIDGLVSGASPDASAADTQSREPALLARAAALRDSGSAAEILEMGEFLLFRGDALRAADLLAGAGPAGRRLRVLALILLGAHAEAVSTLLASSEPSDLLWAAQLSDGLHPGVGGVALTEQALAAAKQDPGLLPARARAIEALLAGCGRDLAKEQVLLYEKLELLGGTAAISETVGDGASSAPADRPLRRVDLFSTALDLARGLSQSSDDSENRVAAALCDWVATFCARYPDAAAHLARHQAVYRSARLYERRGDLALAAERWQELGLLMADISGVAHGREPSPSSELHAHADRAAQAVALSYLQRAAELWEALSLAKSDPASRQRARALYAGLSVLGVLDEVLVLRRVLLLLDAGGEGRAEAVAALTALAESQKGADRIRLLARAARAAEGLLGGTAEALDAFDVTLGELEVFPGDGQTEPTDLLTLLRSERRRRRPEGLIALYRRLGSSTTQPEMAAASRGLAVALAASFRPEHSDLLSLQEEAERHLGERGSVLPAATRVLVMQRLGRYGEVGAALSQLVSLVRSDESKLHLYRQLGQHAAEHIGDFALAERSFAEVLSRQPGDVVALHALARIVSQRGERERAAKLLEQAVAAALRLPAEQVSLDPQSLRSKKPTAPRLAGLGLGLDSEPDLGSQAAALLFCELGALYEQLGNEQKAALASSAAQSSVEQAIACYEEALRRDPRCRSAARALVALYRSLGRSADLLRSLGLLLPLLRDDAQRLGLLLEQGEVAELRAEQGAAENSVLAEADLEAALSAYAEVLALDPAHQLAQARLYKLCQRTRRWALLAEALDRSPRTLSVLEMLREAQENLGDPRALARILEEQLGQVTEKADLVTQSRALAQLYQRLEQPDDELRILERLHSQAPEEVENDLAVLLRLETRYGQTGRQTEQATLLRRAIDILGGGEGEVSPERREQRRELLLKLGDLQRDHLGLPGDAIATFEVVVTEFPGDRAALLALSGLYGKEERPTELRRTLSLLIETSTDSPEQARLLLQLGELDERQGNLAEAMGRYGQAFYLDPTNRATFTAYERVCYRREQWSETLRIYDTALKVIETQKTRSYRPADLYLRRGQVLLQYLQQPDEAVQCYLRALESDAENDATQATLERLYAGKNQWRELLSAYERRAALVRDDNKRVEILRRAARVATAKLRDVPEAVRFYEKLHSVDPTDGEALDALEHHYDRTRDFEKLIGLLGTRVALSVDEQQIIALNMRIGLLCEEGLRDHDRAITAYRQVVEQQPTHREALDAMARLFEANERWAELIDVTRRQIRLVTDRSQKALLYFKCGSVTEAKFAKDDDAIRYYEAAVRTSAACLPALHSLRDIYIRREDWTRVTQTLELESKLWTDDKERAGILAHIGQLYIDKLHNEARAIEFFESALAVDRDSIPANRALFGIFFQRGEWERALGASQLLLTRATREGEPSERSEFQRKRAIVALKVGQLKTACEAALSAIDLYPEGRGPLELLITLCRRRGLPHDFGPTCRELEKQLRRRGLFSQLSLVLLAQSALIEPGADIEGVEALLAEAVKLSPDDILVAEATANHYERLRRFSEAQRVLREFAERALADWQRAGDDKALSHGAIDRYCRVQLRLAELQSEALLDSEQAAGELRKLLELEPAVRQQLGAATGATGPVSAATWREVRFRLAQELYALGRYQQARGEVDVLLVAAGNPDLAVPATEQARYHDYLARILEAQGEITGAQQSFRRAIELDGKFVLPVLALARRAALTSDRGQAEQLMREALNQVQAKAKANPHDADIDREELALRRGIARLTAVLDPAKGVVAYRQIIESREDKSGRGAPSALTQLDQLDDRLALADLLESRVGDLPSARAELFELLRRDLRCGPAYALLAKTYERASMPQRIDRIRAVATLLGYTLEEQRRSGPPPLRQAPRHALSDDLRARRLLPPALSTGPLAELFGAVTVPEGLVRLFPPPWPLATETQPASRVADAGFKVCLADAQRLFGLDAEVLVAPQVPGYVLPLEPVQAGGKPMLILDSTILERSDGDRRFLVGWGLEALRGGYALLLRLSQAELAQCERLLLAIVRGPLPGLPVAGAPPPPAAYDAATQDFLQQLPRKSLRTIERIVAVMNASAAATAASPAAPTSAEVAVAQLLQAPVTAAARAGLLFCDDIAASVRMLARRESEDLAAQGGFVGLSGGPGAAGLGNSQAYRTNTAVLLAQVPGGADLCLYYLSDEYQELSSALRDTTRL